MYQMKSVENVENVDQMIVKLTDEAGKSKGFSCKQCNKTEKLKRDVKSHIIQVHVTNSLENNTSKSVEGFQKCVDIEKKDYNLNVMKALENKLKFLDIKNEICVDNTKGAVHGENVMVLVLSLIHI